MLVPKISDVRAREREREREGGGEGEALPILVTVKHNTPAV